MWYVGMDVPQGVGDEGASMIGAAGTSRAHSGQMQLCPRCCGARRASAARDTGWAMHQQPCAGCPAATAHWLDWPHSGQWRVSVAGGMRAGVKKERTAPRGAVLIVNQIGLQRLRGKRWQLLI
jgi:hypothetical protein